MNIKGYMFEIGHGLYNTNFNEVAGIYLVYTPSGKIIDIGQTDSLKRRMANHERKILWFFQANQEQILIAFHSETNLEQRLLKEKYLRLSLNPLCGEK